MCRDEWAAVQVCLGPRIRRTDGQDLRGPGRQRQRGERVVYVFVLISLVTSPPSTPRLPVGCMSSFSLLGESEHNWSCPITVPVTAKSHQSSQLALSSWRQIQATFSDNEPVGQRVQGPAELLYLLTNSLAPLCLCLCECMIWELRERLNPNMMSNMEWQIVWITIQAALGHHSYYSRLFSNSIVWFIRWIIFVFWWMYLTVVSVYACWVWWLQTEVKWQGCVE